MKDHTTNPVGGKTRRDLLLSVLRAVGRKVFAAEDVRARDLGWEITPSHHGLRRKYRDPRFKCLSACTACDGEGFDSSGMTCVDCSGTGRVRLAAANVRQPREG